MDLSAAATVGPGNIDYDFGATLSEVPHLGRERHHSPAEIFRLQAENLRGLAFISFWAKSNVAATFCSA
jgi:hypothetical protein